MLAAIEGVDLARLLLDLLIVVVAAKLVAELAERVGIPAVLGEIAAGVVIGPSVLAAAFGAIVAMLFTHTKTGKPDPGMMANGMLAGLVAITAPCAFLTPAMSAVIGSLAGILVVLAIGFVERRGVDDPVGAISVHGICGTFGVLSVGLFANGSYGAAWNGSEVEGVEGIFFGGGAGQLAAQALGAVVIWTVIFGIVFAFFKIQDSVSKAMGKGGIRSKEADELEGLDEPEMGVLAYPSFVGSHAPVLDASDGSLRSRGRARPT